MIIRIKYLNDSLTTVGILAPGCEFYSAKYIQFSFIFTEWN